MFPGNESAKRWFQSYTPSQYNQYLQTKAFSEYALSLYERLYINSRSLAHPLTRKDISTGKKALRVAKGMRDKSAEYPASLRHLMKLDWEHCIESCMAIHELLAGEADSDLRLIELTQKYISQRSQYVDIDDLDMLLGRSNYAFCLLARDLINNQCSTSDSCIELLNEANHILNLDLETMITQVRASVSHMHILDSDNKFLISLVKNYDDRFSMQRKAIRYLNEVTRTPVEISAHPNHTVKDPDAVIESLNRLFCQSAGLIIRKLSVENPRNLTD